VREKLIFIYAYDSLMCMIHTNDDVDHISFIFSLAEESAKVQMQNFVRSSAPVICYVDDLFTSRNLGIDW
jgi:hypothetical protein